MTSYNVQICCKEGRACLPKRYELAEAIQVANDLYESAERYGTRLTVLSYVVFSDSSPVVHMTPVVSHVITDGQEGGEAGPGPAEPQPTASAAASVSGRPASRGQLQARAVIALAPSHVDPQD